MATEQEGLEALNQIETSLQEQEAVRGIPSLGEVCEQYRNIRPLVDRSLFLIELIPVYGSKIGATIRFLTKVADMACPGPASSR